MNAHGRRIRRRKLAKEAAKVAKEKGVRPLVSAKPEAKFSNNDLGPNYKENIRKKNQQ